MRFAKRVNSVAGQGADAWDTHYQALRDQQHDQDVIVLSVGDPDFTTPTKIRAAAIRAIDEGDTHYTPILGRAPLCQRIAELFRQTTGVDVGGENVAVLAGAQNALFTASMCLLEPEDEVISFDPMYLTYEAYLGVSGATVVRLPSTQELRPNLEALTAAINPNTRAIAFSNPNNPSGIVMTHEELSAIAELAIQNDLWVIADEVYSALTFECSHTSIAALPGMSERTVTINSLSKSHAMTGWRLGWMIAPRELIVHVENMALCMLYGLPGFIQQAGLEALTNSLSEQDSMREVYLQRRLAVCAELESIEQFKVLEPEAGMFLLVDVSATGKTGGEFAAQLYQQQKVSVLDGSAFGQDLQYCIRISFTSDQQTLTEACQRIRHFVSSS